MTKENLKKYGKPVAKGGGILALITTLVTVVYGQLTRVDVIEVKTQVNTRSIERVEKQYREDLKDINDKLDRILVQLID